MHVYNIIRNNEIAGPPSTVTESLVRAPVRPHTFLEIYHEIISEVILPLPLIQEGHVSFWRKYLH